MVQLKDNFFASAVSTPPPCIAMGIYHFIKITVPQPTALQSFTYMMTSNRQHQNSVNHQPVRTKHHRPTHFTESNLPSVADLIKTKWLAYIQRCTTTLRASSMNACKIASLFSYQTVNSKHSSIQQLITSGLVTANHYVLKSHKNILQLLFYTHNWQITNRNTTVSFPQEPFIHHLRYKPLRDH